MKLHEDDRARLDGVIAATSRLEQFSFKTLEMGRANERAQAERIRELEAEVVQRDAVIAELALRQASWPQVVGLAQKAIELAEKPATVVEPSKATPAPKARPAAKRAPAKRPAKKAKTTARRR